MQNCTLPIDYGCFTATPCSANHRLQSPSLCFMVWSAPVIYLGEAVEPPPQARDWRQRRLVVQPNHETRWDWLGGSPSAAATSPPAPRSQRAGDRLLRSGRQAANLTRG